MNKYLSFLKHIPSGIYNFAGLIDFANKHPDLELPEGETDQAVFIDTLYRPLYAPTQIDDEGRQKITYNKTYISGQRVIKKAEIEVEKVMKKYRLTTLIGPSESYLFSLAAKIGFPSISVPSGFLRSSGVQANPKVRPIWPFNGAPTGLCLVAAKWEEETLLKVARGFEVMQVRTGRGGYDNKVRTFKAATPITQLQDVMQKEI
jgi:amidase